jgi:sialate O-acetylesterase
MKTTPLALPSRLFPIILALGAGAALADVKLPPAVSDHMVLQRDFAAPIWGTAAPGEEISVSIAGQTKSTKADDKGNWRVKLDPLKVAEGLTLTVKGKNAIEIKDVLVGEVWVGSGQSNMDMLAKSYTAGDPVLAKAVTETYPKLRLLSKGRKGWEEATPANNENFSALLFSFGFRLQQELKIPVGIMVGAVGGTPSGYWLTEEMYRSDAACQEQVKRFAATYDFEAANRKYDGDLAKWKEADELAKKENKKAPGQPRPPAKAGESTGKIGNLYEAHIRPYVGYGIRGVLWDQGESGTAITGVDQYTLMGALIRGWRKEWGQGDFPFLYIQKPSGGGAAWDYEDAVTKDGGKFGPPPAAVPGDGSNRETHIRIASYPQTAMVISSDLGGGTHPTNKSGYGARAVRVALGFVYGEKVEFYGPVYESHKIEGGKVRLKFLHTGKGLAARHAEKLQGFAIAGEDKKFVWADAVIDGDSVVVSSASVPKPAAVRYAWAGSFPWANLFNKDGLPAQTFRTDDWK